MRAILFSPLLLMLVAPIQNPAPGNDGSPVAVLSSKWARSRLIVDQAKLRFRPSGSGSDLRE